MIHKEIHKSQDKHETFLAVQRLSKTGGVGSITGQGAKMPRDLQPNNQNIKQKQYYNKFNEDFLKKWST